MMEEQNREQEVPADAVSGGCGAEESEPVEPEVETAKKALAEALEETAKLQAELAEIRDKYLRMLAEYDNYRKRTTKEREGTYTEAVADTVGGILPVLDVLEKASQYHDAEKIAEGLSLTVKQASALLSKLNIEETAHPGDKFDPNLHNAVLHVEDDAYGEGEIVEVLQRGYRRGDKIIRHAMVKVAN